MHEKAQETKSDDGDLTSSVAVLLVFDLFLRSVAADAKLIPSGEWPGLASRER